MTKYTWKLQSQHFPQRSQWKSCFFDEARKQCIWGNFFHKVHIWKTFSFYAVRKYVFTVLYFPQPLQLKDLLLSCSTNICLQRITFSANITSERFVRVWNKEICKQKLVSFINIKSENLFHDEITKCACKANIFHKHHYKSLVSLKKQENNASKAYFFHKVYIWKIFSFYALRKYVFID